MIFELFANGRVRLVDPTRRLRSKYWLTLNPRPFCACPGWKAGSRNGLECIHLAAFRKLNLVFVPAEDDW